jgi:ABC-type uncharacterized transport system
VLAGCAPASKPTKDLYILTGLPLFWTEADLSIAAAPAPVVQALAKAYRVKPIDALSTDRLRPIKLMILAQPRGLAPKELVAFDAWVRAGGKALIFADPQLSWPSVLPLGDSRRPPLVTLLDPLFLHWGVTLDAGRSDPGVTRLVKLAGVDVAVQSAGQWSNTRQTCVASDLQLLLDCRIGRGRVTLIADADLLDLNLSDELGAANDTAILKLLARLESRTRNEQKGVGH